MNKDNKTTCALCGAAMKYEPEAKFNGESYDYGRYTCPNCGLYVLEFLLDEDLRNPPGDRAFRLACLLYEKRSKGLTGCVGILDDNAQGADATIGRHLSAYWHISELLREFPKPTQIADRALLNLSRMVKHPLDVIDLNYEQLQLPLFCKGDSAFRMYQFMTKAELLVEWNSTRAGLGFSISPQGWNRVDELERTRSDSLQAFIAIWFAPEMKIYSKDGIESGIRDAGYKPTRIDSKDHNNKIDDEIVAEIRRSRFIVADFTAGCCKNCTECGLKEGCKDKVRPRGGVYFEAGFAMGLGIPVIWTVKQDQIDQVHFDTRQYNYIVYENPQELRERLRNRIRATIGQGPVTE